VDPLYCSIPFFIKISKGKVQGFFINFPGKIKIDAGVSIYDQISCLVYSSSFCIYAFEGQNPDDIVMAYSRITGLPFRLPDWALEHQISRYSYYPGEHILEILKKYQEAFGKESVGSIYLDIDYMQDYKIFTYDPIKFGNMKDFIDRAHEMNVKVIPIIDPGIKIDQDYDIFKEGLGNYVETPKGNIFSGIVWPGSCAFPDFFKRSAAEFWKREIESFMKNGFDGIWLDMNEPSVQNEENKKILENMIHSIGGNSVNHVDVHNAYALAEAKATYEAIGENRFILSRAGYAGIQEICGCMVW
ncbi:Alpha-glucosidase, partial [mine drainage metagenome]